MLVSKRIRFIIISLDKYIEFWNNIEPSAKEKVTSLWLSPQFAKDLENKNFTINGIRFGKIVILIQPTRGYTEDNILDIHSPTLPPPHRYLAQYNWLQSDFSAHAIVHLGKHGSAEWLPGKSVGLSQECFPQIIIPPIPYIYPFISC